MAFKTLKDNIFYNKPTNDISAGNICSTISGYLIQFLIEPKFSCKTTSNVKKKAKCYKNFNQQAFKSALDKINWERVVNADDLKIVKDYLCYKTITSQNVSSETQVKNFFIS